MPCFNFQPHAVMMQYVRLLRVPQLPVGVLEYTSQQQSSSAALLRINSIEVSDEAEYECLVKPVDGAAISATHSLQVAGKVLNFL